MSLRTTVGFIGHSVDIYLNSYRKLEVFGESEPFQACYFPSENCNVLKLSLFDADVALSLFLTCMHIFICLPSERIDYSLITFFRKLKDAKLILGDFAKMSKLPSVSFCLPFPVHVRDIEHAFIGQLRRILEADGIIYEGKHSNPEPSPCPLFRLSSKFYVLALPALPLPQNILTEKISPVPIPKPQNLASVSHLPSWMCADGLELLKSQELTVVHQRYTLNAYLYVSIIPTHLIAPKMFLQNLRRNLIRCMIFVCCLFKEKSLF
jgi:hypothetical protein